GVRLTRVRQGRVRQGRVRQGRVRQGRVRQGRVRQGRVRQTRVRRRVSVNASSDLGEVSREVRQALRALAELRTTGDQAPGVLEVVGSSDGERRRDTALVEVPDRELALVKGAADDLLVPLVGGPDVLEPCPIGEIGEEVRR